jgi:hypothetical protein
MVRTWKSSRESIEEKIPIYEVETILERSVHGGEDCYLVQWKGYPLAKDRTFEPCERLRIDVPVMVDAFERTRRE